MPKKSAVKNKTRQCVLKRVKKTKHGFMRKKTCKNHRITGKGKTVREDKNGLPIQGSLKKKVVQMTT